MKRKAIITVEAIIDAPADTKNADIEVAVDVSVNGDNAEVIEGRVVEHKWEAVAEEPVEA